MIKEAMAAYAATLNKTFVEDRSQTVGASEIGLCARRTWLTKQSLRTPKKHPPEEQGSWGAHVRGAMMEEYLWVPAMRAKWGKRLMWAGKEQKTFKKDFLSATPDGMLMGVKNELREFGIKTVKSGNVMLECKTLDPRVNLKEAKAENRYQVQVQMGLLRDCTTYKPEYAIISYTNASFWDEVTEYVEAFDQKIYDNAHVRAAQIMTAKRMEDVTPEGIIGGKKECEYCPFTLQCFKDVRDVPKYETAKEDLPAQWVEMIEQLCNEYSEHKADAKALEAKAETVKLEIKDELKEKNVRKIPGIVAWSPVKGANRIDNKAFQAAAEAAGVDPDDYRIEGSPTDRFEVL
jgi:hypothetical protein